jgi:hypothetical protein
MKQTTAAWGLILVLGCGMVTGSARLAAASVKGRRNTTLLLGAATLGTALAGKKKAAWILGAGTAVAGYRWYAAAQRAKRKQARAAHSARVASYRATSHRATHAASHVALAATRPAARVAYARAPVTQPAAQTAAPAQTAAALPVAPTAVGSTAPVSPAPADDGNSSLPGSALLFGGGALASALGVGLWTARRRRLAA